MKTIREQALEWWNNIKDFDEHSIFKGKYGLCFRYYPGREWQYLTGREIEDIWRKETQLNSSPLKSFNLEKVDFYRLSTSIRFLTNIKAVHSDRFTEEELSNIELLFDLLSKSSSFAHKAHKELKKLNS